MSEKISAGSSAVETLFAISNVVMVSTVDVVYVNLKGGLLLPNRELKLLGL